MPPLDPATALAIALQHHRAGHLAEADAAYRQILAVQPDHADALHLLGVLLHQQGASDAAAELIRRAILLRPSFRAAHTNLGEVYRAMGRLVEAIATFRQALELAPEDAVTWCNLGNALREQGSLPAAADACRRAIQLNPNLAEAYNGLGLVLSDQDNLQESLSAYYQALQLKPDYAPAHLNRGEVLARVGESAAAISAFREAIALRPDYALAYNNLGILLSEGGQPEDAIAACRQAIRFKPDFAEAYNSLGLALAKVGQFDEAVQAYETALQFKPRYAEAQNNLGLAFQNRRQLDKAIAAYQSALRLRPTYAEALSNLSDAFKWCGQLDKAVEACEAALRLKPDLSEAHTNLGNLLKDRGEINAALQAYRRAIESKPQDSAAYSNLVYTLEFQPGETASSEAHRERENWNRLFGRIAAASPVSDASPRRLRVGYVSPYFRQHVIGTNLRPLFHHHDRDGFEIFCYSGVTLPDALTRDLRQRADHWTSTLGISDEALAEIIRRDRIDVLVDLTQHLAGNRLQLFVHHPAPVQVSFAGYPESTGLGAIPYRISDRWLEPDGKLEPDGMRIKVRGHEQIYLLDSFWSYNPCGLELAVNELPAHQSGVITFGSLNNFCKVNEPLLKLWARVLKAIRHSRLVILSHEGSHRQMTLQILEQEGIENQRVEFVAPCPREDYLKVYHRIDIVLDTFPYNGHTTSLDALWMGVPVVSLCGERPVSRAGWSQLSNLGLPELVAHTEDEYVDIAARLASDIPHLSDLRRHLRQRMEKSVLMDAPHFARQIEACYRTMCRQRHGV